jgi:hypothetical protein
MQVNYELILEISDSRVREQQFFYIMNPEESEYLRRIYTKLELAVREKHVCEAKNYREQAKSYLACLPKRLQLSH